MYVTLTLLPTPTKEDAMKIPEVIESTPEFWPLAAIVLVLLLVLLYCQLVRWADRSPASELAKAHRELEAQRKRIAWMEQQEIVYDNGN